MLILGIETSCDETSAAVVRGGRTVLSNFVASQHDLHAEYAGVVPEIASRAHVERVLPVIRSALEEAGVGLGMIDAIAVGNRPGLIGSLLIGVAAAKALSWSLGKPLIGVDHVHAHLYAGALRCGYEIQDTSITDQGIDETSALFPALGLVVSGGHTSLYVLQSFTDLKRIGATIDDALGEAYDKAAAILGIGFPGGPTLDRLAEEGGGDDRSHEFPISRLGVESLDFSFSGLKTAVLYATRGLPGPGGSFARDSSSLLQRERADLAASFQRAACRAVVLKLERALQQQISLAGTPFRSVLTGGGVTANRRLRRELSMLAQRHGVQLLLPELAYCVDNAAMIAGLAHEHARAGLVSDLTIQAVPTTSC